MDQRISYWNRILKNFWSSTKDKNYFREEHNLVVDSFEDYALKNEIVFEAPFLELFTTFMSPATNSGVTATYGLGYFDSRLTPWGQSTKLRQVLKHNEVATYSISGNQTSDSYKVAEQANSISGFGRLYFVGLGYAWEDFELFLNLRRASLNYSFEKIVTRILISGSSVERFTKEQENIDFDAEVEVSFYSLGAAYRF